MVLLHAFDYLIAPTIEFAHFCRGFRYQRTTAAAFDWHYIQRERSASQSTEPVVFVHGFCSWKGSWVKTAALVDEIYKVVIPEMPCHGRTESSDERWQTTVHRSRRGAFKLSWRTQLHPSKGAFGRGFHGWVDRRSLCGHVPRSCAFSYVDLPGWSHNAPEERWLMEDSGSNPLLPQNADEIIELTSYMSHRPKFPRFLAPVVAAFRERNFKTDVKIFNDMAAQPASTLLEDYLPYSRA